MSATKAQSQKIFEKLKTKPANRVRSPLLFWLLWLTALDMLRLWSKQSDLVLCAIWNIPLP